jgi:hypothetical protein
MPTRPILILNPRDDTGFATFAETLVAEGAAAAATLEAGLRERYPRAAVRPRELSSERTVVWYVYRDGHWVPHHQTAKEDE